MTTWSHDVYAHAARRLSLLCMLLAGCNSLLGNDPVRERVDRPDASLGENQLGGSGEGGRGGSGTGGAGRPAPAGRSGGGGAGQGGEPRAGRSGAGQGGAAAQGGTPAAQGGSSAAGSGGSAAGAGAAAGSGGSGAVRCDSLHCPEHSSCDPQRPECRCDGGYDLFVGVCVNRNECLTNNGGCDAHAACTDSPGSFSCACIAPYTGDGKTCKLDDSCQMLHCDANASCTASGCKCLDGYEGNGVTCTRIDPCKSAPCKNGGSCSSTSAAYSCNCSNTGFTGATCEAPIDDCAPNPCKNGGVCQDLVKDYACTCTHGWTGKQCATNTGCDYNGAHYDAGAKFDAGDGCNTCTCQTDGSVSCTKNTCPVTCGGLVGKQCPTGQFCNFPPSANCGANDQQGTCAAMGGMVCPAIVQPVCGCDGKTYSNSCYALSAGVSVRAMGECASAGCDYGGKHYDEGASFPSTDGCNTCSCNMGSVICTKKACTAGCFISAACAAGQYCALPLDAQCGSAMVSGACRAKPGACTDVYSPVCGCDGKTYSNTCFAATAGVSVKAQDVCP